MISFYTATIFISVFGLAILSVIVHDNARLTKQYKKMLYWSYTVLIISILAEWGAYMLNGAPEWTREIHKVIKCTDYAVTPLLMISFGRQLGASKRMDRIACSIVGINAILHIISIFTGWTFYVDAANVYQHGPIYNAYVVVYFLGIVYTLIIFIENAIHYKRKNLLSLVLIFVLLIVGLGIQEFFYSSARTFAITISLAAALLLLHTLEFHQQESDDNILVQQKIIDTDALTGLNSRYAFSKDIETQTISTTFVAVCIDINGLKKTNDTLGHVAGDELIIAASNCIDEVISPYGKVYRVGGDEFVCFINIEKNSIDSLFADLRNKCDTHKGKMINAFSLSIGYARWAEHPDLSLDKLLHEADHMMYLDKKSYYTRSGMDRREI